MPAARKNSNVKSRTVCSAPPGEPPRLCPDLAFAVDDPFARGQSFEPDRPARVQLVGRDADFGAQPVFVAVGKARRRIYYHRARIDFAQEPVRALLIFGDDRVSVLRAVARDVLNRLLEIVDHAHGQDRREILGVPVFLGRPFDARHELARGLVAAQFDTLVLVDFSEPRQHAIGDAARDQERFHRVAGAQALRLGVVRDADRLFNVRLVVDVDVTYAVQMLDHRNARLLHHALDQAFATARDDDVDILVHAQEFADGGPVGRLYYLDRGLRQAGGFESRMHALGNRLVRMQCFRAAAQYAGIAGLQAQARRVGRHVGARFVNDRDHAE